MGQLESVEVEEGTLAKVEVEAIGNGLTYQWYYKNVNAKKFSYTSSFNGPSYFVEMNEARDGRQVYCVITDERGNCLQTETVTLNMKDVAKIVTQPENVVIEKGNIAYVEVEAKGKDLTYAWYYKNAGATKFSYTKSFKTGTYFVEMNKARDGRQVYCVITDAYGNSVQTETVSLHMGNPLEIVSQPQNVKVKNGGKAKVEVIATGDDLTYTWFFKNAGSKEFSYTAAFMGPTYSIVMSKARADRQVYCIITDAYGNSVQTETVTLSMK